MKILRRDLNTFYDIVDGKTSLKWLNDRQLAAHVRILKWAMRKCRMEWLWRKVFPGPNKRVGLSDARLDWIMMSFLLHLEHAREEIKRRKQEEYAAINGGC